MQGPGDKLSPIEESPHGINSVTIRMYRKLVQARHCQVGTSNLYAVRIFGILHSAYISPVNALDIGISVSKLSYDDS
jgi:hypothetical protein